MIAALALMLAASDGGQIVDPDFVGQYGVWTVRCPRAPRDANGRLQCEAIALVGDIGIHAWRENEEIEFDLSSPKCPGVVVRAGASRDMLDPRGRRTTMALPAAQMIQAVLSGTLSLNISRCAAFETTFALDGKTTESAFAIVTSARKPKT